MATASARLATPCQRLRAPCQQLDPASDQLDPASEQLDSDPQPLDPRARVWPDRAEDPPRDGHRPRRPLPPAHSGLHTTTGGAGHAETRGDGFRQPCTQPLAADSLWLRLGESGAEFVAGGPRRPMVPSTDSQTR